MMIINYNENLYPYNDKLYFGYRRVRDNQITLEQAKDLKEYWGCDIVLKTPQYGGVYLFLNEITDVEFEEIK